MELIDPGLPVNLLNNVAIGVQNGSSFALPAAPCMLTWQVTFVTPPASITVQLQGSNDGGVTFGNLDTSTSVTSGNARTTYAACTHIRARINASAGGDFVTVILTAKSLVTPELFQNAQVLAAQSFPIGTDADTNEKTLFSATIPATTFISSIQVYRLRVAGITAANGNTKTLRLKFGADTYTLFSGAVNNLDFIGEYRITRRSGSVQIRAAFGQIGTTLSTPEVTSVALDERSDIAVSVTGQNGTALANDIVLEQAILDKE